MVLVKTCIYENTKNQNDIFPKWKSFLNWKFFYEKTIKPRVCVWYILEQSTNYSILYILTKTKILYLDTSLDLEVFPWSLLILLTWSKHDPSSSTHDVVLMHRLGNQPVLASKYDFKSFVEAPHLLRSWS